MDAASSANVPRDALAELSAVTGGLAHEIRNPLSTLKVNLQLLAEDWRELARRDDDHADPVRRSLQRIETMLREVDRLAHIVEDFLRFAGHHELHRAPTDLNEHVTDALDLLAAQAASQRIEIARDLATSALRADIDADLMKVALWNLLVNALHAMPHGGTLRVATGERAAGELFIAVSDTGCGIPETQLPRIFDAYYSTRKGGTGLGLPTARRIVAEHGGRIDVQTEPGRGSTFTIVLPPPSPAASG